ncbi:hypothetical protein EXN66_Car000875 [Channa argus]|uniref:Uncharacterized protein n=1 Tax=Channa argus TaxID=215402 RepID=A0A6G1QYI9_CHAAH|nr:hypothetical protein EXN66_Car000875 [Channa argus]
MLEVDVQLTESEEGREVAVAQSAQRRTSLSTVVFSKIPSSSVSLLLPCGTSFFCHDKEQDKQDIGYFLLIKDLATETQIFPISLKNL